MPPPPSPQKACPYCGAGEAFDCGDGLAVCDACACILVRDHDRSVRVALPDDVSAVSKKTMEQIDASTRLVMLRQARPPSS